MVWALSYHANYQSGTCTRAHRCHGRIGKGDFIYVSISTPAIRVGRSLGNGTKEVN